MCDNNEIFTQCDVCGRDIRYGNAVVEIKRHIEQYDIEEETGLHSVMVIDAYPLATLCARCGNCLADRKEGWQQLVCILGLPGPSTDDGASPQTEVGLPETCSNCGAEMKISTARVSLVRQTAQIEWNDELNDSELYVIDGEDVLTFCPDCGNKMSIRRLRQAVHDMLNDLAVPERFEFKKVPAGCCCGKPTIDGKGHSVAMANEEDGLSITVAKLRMVREAVQQIHELDDK